MAATLGSLAAQRSPGETMVARVTAPLRVLGDAATVYAMIMAAASPRDLAVAVMTGLDLGGS